MGPDLRGAGLSARGRVAASMGDLSYGQDNQIMGAQQGAIRILRAANASNFSAAWNTC